MQQTQTRERERLPTREQIEAINDVEALQDLRDMAFEQKNSIETQLEFADGSEEWARRAMSALTAHKICIGNIDKWMHRLRTGGKKTQAENEAEAAERKIRKQEASAAHVKAQIESAAALKERVAEKTRMQIAACIEKSHFAHSLQAAMLETLESELHLKVLSRAWQIHDERVSKTVSEFKLKK